MPAPRSKKAPPKKTTLLQGKMKTVKFDRLFPTDRYLNCRIHFDYEPAPGEEPEMVVSNLNKLAEKTWQENFPHMVGKPAESLDEPSPDQEQHNILLSIQNAATIETLYSFRKIAQFNGVFGTAFNVRLNELKKNKFANKRKPDIAILKQYQKAVEEGDEASIASITAVYEIITEDNGAEKK